jgi:hypothetical protein
LVNSKKRILKVAYFKSRSKSMWSGNVPMFWSFVLVSFCAMVILLMMFLFYVTSPLPIVPMFAKSA